MSISVTLNSVTTTDATPTSGTNVISDKAGEDAAVVNFTPVTSDASPIRAWRIVFNAALRNCPSPGKLVGNLGAVCGLDVCGGNRVMPLAATQGVARSEVINYAETALGDGTYDVYIFALSETQGWA